MYKSILFAVVVTLSCRLSFAADNDFAVELGIRIGKPFGQLFTSTLTGAAAQFTHQQFDKPRYVFGPAAGFSFFDRVLIEMDWLNQPTEAEFTNTSVEPPSTVTTTTTTIKGSAWALSAIGNYRFTRSNFRPFAGAGVVLDERVLDRPRRQAGALIVNGGLEWRNPYIILRPTLRYIHWGTYSQPDTAVRAPNEYEFLLGVSFPVFSSP